MNKLFLIVIVIAVSSESLLLADETNIYESRILPIAKSQKSSGCTECHFGGAELGNFIGENEQATFASLRDQGCIRPFANVLIQLTPGCSLNTIQSMTVGQDRCPSCLYLGSIL